MNAWEIQPRALLLRVARVVEQIVSRSKIRGTRRHGADRLRSPTTLRRSFPLSTDRTPISARFPQICPSILFFLEFQGKAFTVGGAQAFPWEA